jgi:hypothetical protein
MAQSDIRTPDDEIERPGFFYPPFKEGWWYEGITYGGHTDYSVDWNRRERKGNSWNWVQDEGDPVFAAADGMVAEIDKGNGVVMLNHYGGLWRTEYRHMTGIKVKVGDRVQRSDHIGDIGGVNDYAGKPFSPHLHHVHWKRSDTSKEFERVKQAFYGQPIRTSVHDSDSRPENWNAPEAVYMQGPPPKATWESAFKEAEKRLKASESLVKKLKEQIAQTPAGDAALKAQVEQLELDVAKLQQKIDSLKTPLDALVKAYVA